ncbi:MAG: MFS transporter [Actinomycetota bacterium]
MHHPVLHHIEAPADSKPLYRWRWYALIVLCGALLIGQLDMTVVAMALSEIGPDLDATTSELQWVMDSYAIVLACFVLLGGGLADRYGRKGVFMLGLVIFGAASVVGAGATDADVLIAARAAMGLGAALFFPPALSIIAVIFPKRERATAIAIWSAIGGLGTVAGPIVGGVLLDAFWWGSVLLINLPVVVAALVGAAIVVPTSRRPGAPTLDRGGALLSVVALGLVVFAVIEGPNLGWTSPAIIVAMLSGLALSAAFVAWELRRVEPMLDVRVLKVPGVQAGAVGLVVDLLAVTGLLFAVPLYLQSVRGESAIAAALVLAPFGGLFAVVSFTAMPMAKRFGLRIVLAAGLVGVVAGFAILALTATADGLAGVVVGTAVFGAGAAWVAPTGTTVVINSIPTTKAGDSAAINLVTRQVGAALGIALVGTVVASVYSRDVASSVDSLSTTDAETASSSIDGANTVADGLSSGGDALRVAADTAFEAGYRAALFVVAGIAAVTATFVWLRLRQEEV